MRGGVEDVLEFAGGFEVFGDGGQRAGVVVADGEEVGEGGEGGHGLKRHWIPAFAGMTERVILRAVS